MTETDPKTDIPNVKDAEMAAATRAALIAKARKEKAEAEKDEALAQRDKLKAELGPAGDQSKITAPTGDVTTDQAGFTETQMLAQEAARKIARRLAHDLREVVKGSAKTLIIYSGAEMTALASYVFVLEQLGEFDREFGLWADEGRRAVADAKLLLADPDVPAGADMALAAAVPAIAAGVVGSVAELVNLFRTTTEFKNKAVTVAEDLLVSYLFKSLSSQNSNPPPQPAGDSVNVYYPAYFPPKLLATSADSQLVMILKKIMANRLIALERIGDIGVTVASLTNAITTAETDSQTKAQEVANKTLERDALAATDPNRTTLEGEIQQLRADIKKLENRGRRYQPALAMLNDLKSKLQRLDAAVEQVTINLNTPDATTKLTPMSQLIRAERLSSVMNEKTTYTLRLNVTANGTTMIRKNLFWNARVKHSAGVSLVYQLFDRNGKIVRADGMQYYYEWKTAEEVRQVIIGASTYNWDAAESH